MELSRRAGRPQEGPPLTKPERDGKIEVPAGAGRNLEN